MQDWVGQTVEARYEVTARLGVGGMAAVYRAEDLRLNRRPVALKHPRRDQDRVAGGLTDAELRHRFQKEIAKLIELGEIDGIVPIRDQGEHEGVPYFVMPLMEGGSLEDALAQGPQGPDAVLVWARRIAEALDALHAHHPPVLHRDVKPANLLFDAKGRAHLADFGIVKELNAAWATTSQNTGIGTPGYMPPEQFLPTREIDARSDQYALAATLYRALSGQPPQYVTTGGHAHRLSEASTAAAGKGRKQLKPLNADDLAPHLPPAAAAAIARGLAEEQEARFPSCAALVEALTAALEAPPARRHADDRKQLGGAADVRSARAGPKADHSGPGQAPPPLPGLAQAREASRVAHRQVGRPLRVGERGPSDDLGREVNAAQARRRWGRALILASLGLMLLLPSAFAIQSGSDLILHGFLVSFGCWVFATAAMRLTFLALRGISPNVPQWWVATPLNTLAGAMAAGLSIMKLGTLDRIGELPSFLAGLGVLGVVTGLLWSGRASPAATTDAMDGPPPLPDPLRGPDAAAPTEVGRRRWRHWPGWVMCLSSVALGTASLVFTEGLRDEFGFLVAWRSASDLLGYWTVVHATLLLACTLPSLRGVRPASPRLWLALLALLSAGSVAGATLTIGVSVLNSLVGSGVAYLGVMAGIALAVPPWVAASSHHFWPTAALGPLGAPKPGRIVAALALCAAVAVPAWLVADRAVGRAQIATSEERRLR